MDLAPDRSEGVIETQALPGSSGSQGSWERFEALYRSSRDDVYAYVATLLRDRSAAEDVTALAFEGGPCVCYPCTMAATTEETIALLERVPVFSTLSGEDLQEVSQVAVPRSFASGAVVFREGDQSDTCYVVRAGRARAVREHSPGRTITLATFGSGDIFGELAMFDAERRSATIETLEDTELLAILGSDMRRLLRTHPDIAVKLLSALGRRLRETNDRLTRQSFQTVQSRVASVLAELVASARSEGAAETDVLITATQADLAQLAGSSRESASRFLAVLERAGIITQGRGKLTVHDPGRLEGYVY